MKPLSEDEFNRLVEYVRRTYGIHLEKKRELVISRLSFYVEQHGYASFTDYLNAIMRAPDGPECRHMIDRLSTNHTFFFREGDCFRHMIATAVPALIGSGANAIRVWCAAASSGQECYSVAMELDSYLRGNAPRVDYAVLGTDINEKVLETARRGVYGRSELSNIPERFRGLYLEGTDGDTFSVSPALMRHCSWQRKNLMEPFGFPYAFDLIFCRNVMIYFLPETRAELTKRLSGALRSGGYLYVSTTETIDMGRQYFRYIAPSIYQKGA